LDRHACQAVNVVGYRFYATTGAKQVKQISKEDRNLPPTSPTSAPSAKKHIEPRLVPRKPDTGVQGPTQSQGHGNRTSTTSSNASTSPSVEKSISASSSIRSTKPHLVQPVELDDQGVIKTALNDIDDALSNGTLQPLPPDLAARSTSTQNIGGITFNADTGRVWWHKLKEMTKFYFFGVTKLAREHRIIARDVRRRLKESEEKGLNGVSEWRDKEFLTTYKMDLLRFVLVLRCKRFSDIFSDRLIPFVSIIIILEEILPLVIIYAPFLLPSTCKLPSQARRIEDLGDKKRWDALLSLGRVLQLKEELDPALKSSQGLPLLGHEQGTAEGRLDRLPEGSIPLLCR
jgi:LETM1 and EF-hand domain-containing protein 1, mitochondrial